MTMLVWGGRYIHAYTVGNGDIMLEVWGTYNVGNGGIMLEVWGYNARSWEYNVRSLGYIVRSLGVQ